MPYCIKVLRRERERFHRLQYSHKFICLSLLISKSIKRIDLPHVNQPLTIGKSRHPWQGIQLLCGSKKSIGYAAGVEGINQAFIYPYNICAVSWSLDELGDVITFPREEMFKPLHWTKITVGIGPDSTSSLLLKYGVASLTETFISFLNTPFPIVGDWSI